MLDFDENFDAVIYVYDIENDVSKGIDTPDPMIIYNSFTLDPERKLFL